MEKRIHVGPMFEERHPHLAEFAAFLEEFNKETDRGAVLVAATLLDELLKRVLLAFLIENRGASDLTTGLNAPFSTFSARIAGCYAMGLVSEVEHQDCHAVRKVRNEFAHSLSASFDAPKIIGLCASLHHSAKPYGDVTVNTRGKFSTAAVGLILNLNNREHYVAQRRLQEQSWPY